VPSNKDHKNYKVSIMPIQCYSGGKNLHNFPRLCHNYLEKDNEKDKSAYRIVTNKNIFICCFKSSLDSISYAAK
jgi:hypothetical protein